MNTPSTLPRFEQTMKVCYAALVTLAVLGLAWVCLVHLSIGAAIIAFAFLALFGAMLGAPILAGTAVLLAGVITLSASAWRAARRQFR